MSNIPLTPAEQSLLAKGPNFAVAPPPKPLNVDYIAAVESVNNKLTDQETQESRQMSIAYLEGHKHQGPI